MVRGLGGRNARQVDGCRESEVSREWLIGDTIFWLWNGFNALEEPRPGGCNGGAQRPPCQDGFVLQNTSCDCALMAETCSFCVSQLRQGYKRAQSTRSPDLPRNTRPTRLQIVERPSELNSWLHRHRRSTATTKLVNSISKLIMVSTHGELPSISGWVECAHRKI
jgi:hypothetical protein